MGGTYQHETFETLEELLEYVGEQIRAANVVKLYLLSGRITQLPFPEKGFEWTAYFSK